MFHFISRREYFIGLTILMVAYYIVVAVFCCRREIAVLMKGRTNRQVKNPIENNDIADLEQVVGEINGILVAAGKDADKSKLLTGLKERLASFAGLRQPAYRVALTNYIIKYAQTFCGVAFSEEELEGAWETLLR